MTPVKEKSPIKLLTDEVFPGARFPLNVIKSAAKILKANREKAVAYLATALREYGPTPGDFKPPAKCLILEQSRPFEEWPIYKASAAIQEFVFGMTETEYRATPCPGTGNPEHVKWFEKTGVPDFGFTSNNGRNILFGNAYSWRGARYTREETRQKKNAAKGCELYGPDSSEIGDDGKLKNPPGINPSIFVWAQYSPKAIDGDKVLPKMGNRLDIAPGMRGFIPLWQRPLVNRKKKRIRVRDAGQPIVATIKMGEDWVKIDLRGLLRNVSYRFSVHSMTPNKLLAMFTGDPVIDPRRNIVTFTYKAGVVPVTSRELVLGKSTPKVLHSLAEKGPVVLASIDLGVTNPVAMKASSLTPTSFETIDRTFLPSEQVRQLWDYQKAMDEFNREMRAAARATLTPEQQDECRQLDASAANTSALSIASSLGIPLEAVDWKAMTSRSTMIADALLARSPNDPRAYARGKDEAVAVKRDSRFAAEVRPRLSRETNTALRLAEWEQQRGNGRFLAFSKRKEQLARTIANGIVRWAQSLNPEATVALAVENLEVVFFHGRGKLAGGGWDAFFAPKEEKRWFIQALHKALTDLAKHRGMVVCEVAPQRTSQTCPDCGHCDKDNRRGEDFACQACGVCLHADLDVATDNIERVALTGLRMPKTQASAGNDSGKAKNATAEVLESGKTKKIKKLRSGVLGTSRPADVQAEVLENAAAAA